MGLSLFDLLEVYDIASTTKMRHDEGMDLAQAGAMALGESVAWSVAPGIMGTKLALDVAPQLAEVADMSFKNSKSTYDQELGANGEVGNSGMGMNTLQNQLQSHGMRSIRENQRSLNKNFGDEARRYSRR